MWEFFLMLLPGIWWAVDTYRWQAREAQVADQFQKSTATWCVDRERLFEWRGWPWCMFCLRHSLNSVDELQGVVELCERLGSWKTGPIRAVLLDATRQDRDSATSTLPFHLLHGVEVLEEATISELLALPTRGSLRVLHFYFTTGDVQRELLSIVEFYNLEKLRLYGITLNTTHKVAGDVWLLLLRLRHLKSISISECCDDVRPETYSRLADLPYLEEFWFHILNESQNGDRTDRDKCNAEQMEHQLRRLHPYMKIYGGSL
jgi:hypothetical protein